MKRFSPFLLDPGNQCLWRGENTVHLTPKAFSVLLHLVSNAGRLVTKEELLDAVWPQTYVQEAVLKVCVLEIRKALGESTKDAKFLSTVHKRGYRFIAPVTDVQSPKPGVRAQADLWGREADLERLELLCDRAAAGERQIAFITGEPGIGKSTLIDNFLRKAACSAQIARGQCVEHFGSREAYYPIFDALSRAAREGTVTGLSAVLRRHAPVWLAGLPALASTEDLELLRRETLGATRERMLREICEALETLSAEQPLVLVLEDLHWCDLSTLDIVSWLAARTAHARLLVLATYRPVELILSNHPLKALKQTLLARGQCTELPLELLEERHVAEWLALRFEGHDIPREFASAIYRQTDGNPLFIKNVLEYTVTRKAVMGPDGRWQLDLDPQRIHLEIPDSLSQMIEAQIERLTALEQSTLEAASVTGIRFAVSIVAGAGMTDAASLEEICEELARRTLFICPAGVVDWGPDCVSAQYEFTHSLYREVFYRRLSPMRRVRLHRSAGEAIESANPTRLGNFASELAVHFQEARDPEKAVHYLRLEAQRSLNRHAPREALDALERARGLTEKLSPDLRNKLAFEVNEQIGLVMRLTGQLRNSAAEFERIAEGAAKSGDVDHELRAQLWLASLCSWLDRTRCLRAIDHVIALCDLTGDTALCANARGQVAYWNLLFRGWSAHDVADSATALDAARESGNRAAVALHATRHAYFQSLSSDYRGACRTAEEGVRMAILADTPIDYAVGYFFECWALLHLGDWGRLRKLLADATALVRKNGNHFWVLQFGLLDAFLHLETFSYEKALQMCIEHLREAEKLEHALSIQMSLVLLGRAELGVGNLDEAGKHLHRLRDWQENDRILMDWIWRMPLQFTLVELALARRDISQARYEADRMQEATGQTAERTWIGLGHYASARVAVEENDLTRAAHEVEEGLRTIDGVEAPLAAWRLYDLSGLLRVTAGDSRDAREWIGRLAQSLPEHDELRESFLAAAQGQRSVRLAGA